VTLLIAPILAPLTLLTFCFAVELLAGIRPLRRRPVSVPARATAVIVVPAHDEAAIIGHRLAALKEAAGDRARILVVADNCTDATAEIVRSLMADVIERVDAERRGKGFALDFARLHLKTNPPDVVLIIDADCATDALSIDQLVARSSASGRPCQAVNLQAPRPDGSPAVQLSTFAFFIKNVIRQRALQRITGHGQLLGTGMALPWAIFAGVELATSNIVEDLKLGLELAAAGHPPMFVEEANVWSNAETDRNTLSQRRRWEGGFLKNAFRAGPRMFGKSLLRGDIRGLWTAADMMIPPFALLILLDVTALAVAAALTWLGHARYWPVLALGASIVSAITTVCLAWRAGGSRFVSLGSLWRAPFYIAWKVPIYVAFALRGAPKDWERTGRN
jgi:cellulose synthase/poly-beta-1,6-N-acetylglucosamine synthase-like glycosyltransferase